MRTVHDFARGGIRSVRELREALQLAMQLEFATIPPYLCAQWSIKSDPDRIEGVLHHVVSQEMNHLALAGNLMTAIGGMPRIAHPDFLPRYPLKALPGDVQQESPVDLRPLSFGQVKVFMDIERPEFPPVAFAPKSGPATIGEFYDTIIAAFEAIQPTIYPNAHRIPVILSKPIHSVADAIATMTRIKVEGEGVQDSPEQPTTAGPVHAHYYLFKEIYRQHRLVKLEDGWAFSGDQLTFPDVHPFKRRYKARSLQYKFRRTVTELLLELDGCWRHGSELNVAGMFKLRELGHTLIRMGVQPEFKWLRPWCIAWYI